MIKKTGVVVLLLVLGLILSAVLLLPTIDRPQRDGTLELAALQAPVQVRRGEDGVPYIFADSLDDALTAQGFVVAQDRLFQMELLRHLSQGRLAEFIGERGLQNDRVIRLVNISGHAADYLSRISDADRNYLQRYLDGVNAVVAQPSQHPLMLRVMGHEPQPWTLADALSYQFFAIWSSSVNWKQELLTLRLIDQLGARRAAELYPLTINPDDPETALPNFGDDLVGLNLQLDGRLDSPWQARYAMGSDAWASGNLKSSGGRPILSSDPHLDARNLPGFWYPIGVVTPELRFVGGATPAVPGIGVGRNDYIAWGATNGYADIVDLYIETADPDKPDHYLQGSDSLPFATREELLLIRDREVDSGYREERMLIRETLRGPVISDHGMTLDAGKLISLRWSVPMFLGPNAGNRELLLAKSVDEALTAIGKTPTPLNYIVADVEGNIARQASGLVPIRLSGDGLVPQLVGAEDNWDGRIPAAAMPRQLNLPRGWVGSTNNRVTDADYPYPFSTHFAPGWRYLRLTEIMDGAATPMTTADHWRANLDIKNLLAERLRPRLLAAFAQDPALAELAQTLRNWDLRDDQSLAAPLVFQSVLRQLALETFADDLSGTLLIDYLDESYYWQERFMALLESDDSHWFDDQRTVQLESSDDIIRRAGHQALAELQQDFGTDSARWSWGEAHRIVFSHPFFPGELAARWLGGGIHPQDGSGATLRRGVYRFSQPYESRIVDSIRMIIDLSDSEKVETHYPGGSSERLFDPWNKNFLNAWLSGEKRYLWFSEAAMREHTSQQLILSPPN